MIRCIGVFLAIGVWIGPSIVAAQPPLVTSVSPPPQSTSATTNEPIVVLFDRAIDTRTVTDSTLRVFGRWSGPLRGTFHFSNANLTTEFRPSEPLSAGEWVTVSLSTSVRAATGEAMTRGYTWNYWTRTARAPIQLAEVGRIALRQPGEGHIQSYGAYAGDLDNDGWTDLVIPNEIPNDIRIFINDGEGGYAGFGIQTLTTSLRPSASEGADFNRDGIIDIVVGSTGNSQINILLGDGAGGFDRGTAYTAGVSVRGVGILDIDCDGTDDVVTANRSGDNLSIFVNLGAGTFGQAVSVEAGGAGETSCAVADANGDGIQDVFVGTYQSREIILLLGDGQGGLQFSARTSAGGTPWMLAVGDINGDGDVDVVAANSLRANAGVVTGDGRGGLNPVVTYPTGTFPLAIDVGDLDGDGDLDMVTSNYSGSSWTVYENNGSGNFVNPLTLLAGTAGSCATIHDRDNDGDLDISGIDEEDDLLILFNNGPTPPAPAPAPVLHPNHPNPFNPSTMISFALDAERHVTISIYDVRGRKIRTLVSATYGEGPHEVEWDGTDDDDAAVSSGVYFYRMRAGNTDQSRRMVLVR